MGVVEWFLGIHFSWRITSTSVAVHLNQSGFAANLVESFFQDSRNETPTATPYRSGVPIDSIAPSTEDDDSPSQLRRTAAHQSLIGSIGWLSCSTRPDLSAVHSFLASYSYKPSVGHMKAALYALHYIHSTYDYGISFTSDSVAPMHCYIHFPPLKTLRLIPILNHLLQLPLPPFLLTVMRVGVRRLVVLLLMVLYYRCSNSGV
jgi:hypothetical protein